MSDPNFENIGDRASHLVEELSELIKEVCKAQRFGWDAAYGGITNRERAQSELDDVLKRCKEVGLKISVETEPEAEHASTHLCLKRHNRDEAPPQASRILILRRLYGGGYVLDDDYILLWLKWIPDKAIVAWFGPLPKPEDLLLSGGEE